LLPFERSELCEEADLIEATFMVALVKQNQLACNSINFILMFFY
jgi:hypothetical protein